MTFKEQALCVTELVKTLGDFKTIFESLKRDKFVGEETRDSFDELSDNAMNRERTKREKIFLIIYDKSLEYFSK